MIQKLRIIPIDPFLYQDVPRPFRFDDIIDDVSIYPHVAQVWPTAINILNDYYAKFMVNAETFTDFITNLRIDFFRNVEFFDKKIEGLQKIGFNKGSKTTRALNSRVDNHSSQSSTDNLTQNQTNNNSGNDTRIELAFASTNLKPSEKTERVDNQTLNSTQNSTQNNTSENSSTQTDSETIENIENPNEFYERLIKIYPKIYDDFIDIFKENFSIYEVMIW